MTVLLQSLYYSRQFQSLVELPTHLELRIQNHLDDSHDPDLPNADNIAPEATDQERYLSTQ
jgi:hypothetical protein